MIRVCCLLHMYVLSLLPLSPSLPSDTLPLFRFARTQALPPTILPRPRAPPPPPSSTSASSRPDLLLRLLETDIKHTTSDLSQVIRFLCDNAFLVGVEGKVGELEEEERRGVKEVGVQGGGAGAKEGGGMEGIEDGVTGV